MPVCWNYAALTRGVTVSTIVMPRKKRDEAAEGSKKRTRNTAPIQVDRDLARKVGVICQHREGLTQAAFISPVIRDYVETHYRIVSAEISQEVKEGKPPAGA